MQIFSFIFKNLIAHDTNVPVNCNTNMIYMREWLVNYLKTHETHTISLWMLWKLTKRITVISIAEEDWNLAWPTDPESSVLHLPHKSHLALCSHLMICAPASLTSFQFHLEHHRLFSLPEIFSLCSSIAPSHCLENVIFCHILVQ